MRPPRIAGSLVLAICWLAFGSPSLVAEVIESFDGPQPAWKLAESDCDARLIGPRRFADGGKFGGAEQLYLTMGSGSQLHLAFPLPASRIIDELKLRLWVRADQPGVQLLARVVLPETRDPRDGKALRILVRGEMYTEAGSWQLLTLDNLPKLLDHEVRLLRSRPELGPAVSGRGAYLDFVILNAYSGKRRLELWTDQLTLEGRAAPASPDLAVRLASATLGEGAASGATPAMHVSPIHSLAPALQGTIFSTAKAPLFFRILEHRGEPLELVSALGFNTMLLHRPPAAELVAEANRLGLWIVCPPASMPGESWSQEASERVAAWWLGEGLGEDQHEAVQGEIARLRRLAPVRPATCVCAERMDLYGRTADFLTLEHPGTARLSPAQFNDWLAHKVSQLKGGSPFWVALPSEHPPEISGQLAALGDASRPAVELSPQRLRQFAWHAVAVGARGVVVRSSSSLGRPDPHSKRRRAALEVINEEIAAIEPWAAAGSASVLKTDQADAHATVLTTDRSKLVLVTRNSSANGIRPDIRIVQAPISLTITGVPVSAQAHQVTPRGLVRLRQRLGAGTLRLVLDDALDGAMILISEDPVAVGRLDAWTRQHVRRVASLRSELLAHEVETAAAAQKTVAPRNTDLAEILADTQHSLRQCQRLFDTADPAGSLAAAVTASAQLQLYKTQTWHALGETPETRSSNPCFAALETLPWNDLLSRRISQGRWSVNLLPGGDFESVEQLEAAQWQQQRRDRSGGSLHVELSPHQPRQGLHSLHLSAASTTERLPDDAWAARIVSPPIALRAGQVVQVSFASRVEAKAGAAPTPLVVRDSLGGDPLALELPAAVGWRSQVLCRVAPRDGALRLEFLLYGAAEVWIDDASVCVLEEPAR